MKFLERNPRWLSLTWPTATTKAQRTFSHPSKCSTKFPSCIVLFGSLRVALAFESPCISTKYFAALSRDLTLWQTIQSTKRTLFIIVKVIES
ncbi:hypothetical protein GDO78_003249 [Eleutherodactylus coqui]|uniref:Uncharacterized protein n=1 Tax=Eleutherodactylus coqui TaxID=57060 RepID=A0A8J6EWB9_ELECQ|nr:hypothetical protein GDO78_003249 [Eleutherodactylus coqui]